MKAVVLTGIGQMEIRDIPAPTIKNDLDVLLKIEMVGVCGSDVHYYETGRIGSQVVQYPYMVGHECGATVVETGGSVSRVKVGDQVAVDPAIVCHNCDQCRAGRENTCRNLRFLGCPGQIDGCLCEYMIMPQDSLYPTDGQITLAQAVLSEPLSIGVYAVRQADLGKNADIAILGAGPIGLSVLIAAHYKNIRSAHVTDRINDRVAIAKSAGADWAGNPDDQDVVKSVLDIQNAGMDVVFECAGQQEALDNAIDMLKPGGKLMVLGIPREDRVSFSIDKIRRKEITIINVRRQNNCVQATIDLIASGRVDVDFMITHQFDFSQAKEAFDLVAQYRDGVIKALIEL